MLQSITACGGFRRNSFQKGLNFKASESNVKKKKERERYGKIKSQNKHGF